MNDYSSEFVAAGDFGVGGCLMSTSLWHQLRHPFFWLQESDLPRLKRNAATAFWKPKFDAWREELGKLERLALTTPAIDFHLGTNKTALKAALCFVVDGNEHYGRLVGSFLSAVAHYCRKGPAWRVRMTTNGRGEWTGNQWGGLANNHIIDPQVWLSCGHLYDVIFGRGFMTPEDEGTFEGMMALCHQVSCLHEELHKMDNNRSVWLCAGGYFSTLFDRNEARATVVRERLRDAMFRFLDTILEDGIHYEIGPYGPATIAAMQVFARCIRGVEGKDFFREKVDGVGMEEFYRAWCGTLVPGTSLRLPCYRDRINHWDSIGAAWQEYRIPEIGWALSRMPERPWVPMFQHWPQGMEFYTWSDPGEVQPPAFRHSHFPSAGLTLLRTGWEAQAASLYFRYGFQGSSHGGGLDKLNFELTCNDEPLIADPMLSERSCDKNVVLVDGNDQEQCSGKLLYANLREASPLQYVSAVGGLGDWPKRRFLDDPRAEVNYWCTKSTECFPGLARMRRTVVSVEKQVFVIRDTLTALDDQEHEYQWLFHTFCEASLGSFLRNDQLALFPKRRFYSESTPPESRMVDVFEFSGRELLLSSEKASLAMHWSCFGAELPREIGLSRTSSRYAFNGSPETGDGLSTKALNRLHLRLNGRSVALTTVLVPTPTGRERSVVVEKIDEASLEAGTILIRIDGQLGRIAYDEEKQVWEYASTASRPPAPEDS